MGEEVCCKHENRVAGRVTHFEFVALRDKFAAVPETRCRLKRHHVGDGCDYKDEPTQRVVDQIVFFHCFPIVRQIQSAKIIRCRRLS